MRKMVFILAMAIGTAAQAQDVPRPMVSPACRTEMQNLCPKGDDREARRACMMEKHDKVSAGCQAEMKAVMNARRAARGAEGGPPRGGMGGMGDMNGGSTSGDHGSDGQ